MKITIESTKQVVTLTIDGATVPARLWEGRTESGIPVVCFVTLIRAPHDEDLREFERELEEHRAPSPETRAIPLRFVM